MKYLFIQGPERSILYLHFVDPAKTDDVAELKASQIKDFTFFVADQQTSNVTADQQLLIQEHSLFRNIWIIFLKRRFCFSGDFQFYKKLLYFWWLWCGKWMEMVGNCHYKCLYIKLQWLEVFRMGQSFQSPVPFRGLF